MEKLRFIEDTTAILRALEMQVPSIAELNGEDNLLLQRSKVEDLMNKIRQRTLPFLSKLSPNDIKELEDFISLNLEVVSFWRRGAGIRSVGNLFVLLHPVETVSRYFNEHSQKANIRSVANSENTTFAYTSRVSYGNGGWTNVPRDPGLLSSFTVDPDKETLIFPSPTLAPGTYALIANFIHDQSVTAGILHTT